MKIVDSLPEAQRMTVILYYYDGLTVGEVAEYMEVSEGTVKSRLNYARKQIKDEVEKLEKEGTKLYAIPVFMLSRILENASLDYTLPQSVADRILADALLMASDAAVSGATVGAGAATGAEVAGSMSAATGAGATTGASVATGAVVAASTKTGLLASLAALSITAKIIIIAAAAAIIAAGVIIGVVTSGTGESGDATPPPSGTNENSESASTVPSVTGDGAVFGSDAPDDIIEITLTPGIEPLSFAEYARLFYEYVQQKHVGQDGFLDAEIIDVGRDMPLFFTAYRNDQVPITLYEYKDGSFTVTHLQGLYPGFDPGDAITDVGFFSDGGDVYWISYIQEPQGTINFQAQNLSDISDTFAVLYFPPENYPGRNSQIELFPTNMTGGFLIVPEGAEHERALAEFRRLSTMPQITTFGAYRGGRATDRVIEYTYGERLRAYFEGN